MQAFCFRQLSEGGIFLQYKLAMEAESSLKQFYFLETKQIVLPLSPNDQTKV